MYGLQQYRGYQAETAGPEEQVALLYDGARRFTDKALAALEKADFEQVSHYTVKAQRILEELSAALNFEAGEVSGNLFKLYDWWLRRLSHALIHKDASAFQEVSAALSDMQEAWAQAARQVRAERGGLAIG
jgi:flagellar secretion chaperone FliS